MALHNSEPPSSNKTDKGIKLNIFKSNLLNRLAKTKLASLSVQRLSSAAKFVDVCSGSIKSLWNENMKYLPHFALILLLLVVLFSNINETAKAKALTSDFINVDPDVEYSIIESIGSYTPNISNAQEIVAKSNMALNLSDGFAANIAPVDTQITQREEPLPDNSKDSVFYIVEAGDTLTGLGVKFGVKLATLKYLNDITDINAIKPGVRLKIPTKGYEVASSLIAAKDKANNQKIAAANRNTVARNQSASRTTIAKKTYYGTIGGVKYVEKSYGQCYTYVTSLGYNVGGHYLAKWIPTNSDTPKAGGLVVTYESWAGHVAVVTSVNDDGTFNIRERNYTPGWITERTLHTGDGKIKGFVN